MLRILLQKQRLKQSLQLNSICHTLRIGAEARVVGEVMQPKGSAQREKLYIYTVSEHTLNVQQHHAPACCCPRLLQIHSLQLRTSGKELCWGAHCPGAAPLAPQSASWTRYLRVKTLASQEATPRCAGRDVALRSCSCGEARRTCFAEFRARSMHKRRLRTRLQHSARLSSRL